MLCISYQPRQSPERHPIITTPAFMLQWNTLSRTPSRITTGNIFSLAQVEFCSQESAPNLRKTFCFRVFGISQLLLSDSGPIIWSENEKLSLTTACSEIRALHQHQLCLLTCSPHWSHTWSSASLPGPLYPQSLKRITSLTADSPHQMRSKSWLQPMAGSRALEPLPGWCNEEPPGGMPSACSDLLQGKPARSLTAEGPAQPPGENSAQAKREAQWLGPHAVPPDEGQGTPLSPAWCQTLGKLLMLS